MAAASPAQAATADGHDGHRSDDGHRLRRPDPFGDDPTSRHDDARLPGIEAFAPEFDDPSRNGANRWLARAAVVVGVALVAAALALYLPQEGTGTDTDGDGGRVEAAERLPDASAALLSSDDQLGISGTLADSGELTRRTTTPGERTAILPITGQDTTTTSEASTTTAWVEPPIPPASEWVDAGNGVRLPDVLLRIRFCESTNNYQAANSGSTARGAYQFLIGSWEWYGHAERTGAAQAHLATPAQQDESALLTLQADGTRPWTASRACWSDPDLDPRYATAKPATTTTTAPATSTTAAPTSTTEATSSTSTTRRPTTTTTAPTSSTSTTAESSTTAASSTTTSTTVASTTASTTS